MDPDAERSLIESGLELWRQGAFFEAHECFEQGFRLAEGDKRTRLHALAQLAAGHYQLSLGRARAAASTWGKACRRLASVGALDPAFEGELSAFCRRLGISADGPRLIDLGTLPSPLEWPFPVPLRGG